MPSYRVYPLHRDGSIAGPSTVLECGGKDEAIARANEMVGKLGVELWHGEELILRLQPRE